jgi:hypothetical protein
MSDAARFSLVEMLFSGGVVLALLLWQLWSVKRDQRRHGDRRRDDGDRP